MNIIKQFSLKKKLFRKYSQKMRVLGYIDLPFLVRAMTKKLLFKIKTIQNCGVLKKSKTFSIWLLYLLETW